MASPTSSARACATRCTSTPGPPNGRATSSGSRSCRRAGSRPPATRRHPPRGGSAWCTISPIATPPTWPRGSSASERWENGRRRRDSRPPHSQPHCGWAATPHTCCRCAATCSTSAGRRWSCRPGAGPPRSSRCWTSAPTALCGGGVPAKELDRHGRAVAGRPPPRRCAAGSASPAARLGRHAAHHPAMTFRTRILIGFGVVVLVPLVLFGVRVRTEMATRLTAEYERRVAALAAVIRTHLTRDGAAIARRLDALTEAIVADNRLRGAVLQGGDRTYLLDYAGGAMRFAGLSMLQIQDDQGRIVSSGHFRNEYDRLAPALPRALTAVQGGIALIQARTPEAPMLAIARLDSLRLGGRRFTLVGGIALDSTYLAALSPDSELAVAVRLPTDSAPESAAAGAVVSEVSLPFVLESDSSAVLRPAHIVVSHSLGSVAALRRGVDVAFLAALLLAGAIALLLAGWLSLRISRPLTALALKTAQIDMDRLDVAFDSERADEIGALTRLLGSMTERLRAGAAKLREAERRIAMGDLARQVNHDIKNGLTPIRNVFRHFTETAATEPERLSAVFRERQGTVEASIAYLENLAGNSPPRSPAPPLSRTGA